MIYTLRPSIFFITLTTTFTLCIPVKRGPLLYSSIRLTIVPHAHVREKEDKCVLIERHAEGSRQFVFLVQSRRDCVARNGDGAFVRRCCSLSFAVCTWPLTDILSTHTRIQWYTRVTVDPHTGCHCMRRSQLLVTQYAVPVPTSWTYETQ